MTTNRLVSQEFASGTKVASYGMDASTTKPQSLHSRGSG